MKRAASFLLSLLPACAGTAVESEPAAAPPLHAAARRADPPRVVDDAPTAEPDAPRDPSFDPLVREVAASFSSWGLVDSQLHWAPGLCAMPVIGVQHLSTAPTTAAHGEKVFRLHALDSLAYWKATDNQARLPASLGGRSSITSRNDVIQVLVKESFVPRALDSGMPDRRMVPARKGDAYFGAGDPIGLFVMAQLRDAPAGTDAGWIYATVAADGQVTAAGVLAACRDCHAQQADRVFGMPLHWK